MKTEKKSDDFFSDEDVEEEKPKRLRGSEREKNNLKAVDD